MSLAIDGGVPVRGRQLPYGRQLVEDADIDAVVKTLRSDWLTTGPAVEHFENAFAEAVDAPYAVAFSSGTAALHAAAYCANVVDKEVLVPAMTFCASANCVLYAGGRPVIVDVDDETLCIDVDEVERRISRETGAIVAVDYAGHPADLERLRALTKERSILLIEDAAHALGSVLRGRKIGSISDTTVFSFHPVKHITSAEGGAVTTADQAIADRLRRFRNHGLDTDARERASLGQWHYSMIELGFNYRLSDVHSALGLSQLGRLSSNLTRRRSIAATYESALKGLDGIRLPSTVGDVAHAWHLYPVRLRLESLSVGRDQVFRALRAEGIGVNVHYIPVNLHPYYRKELGTNPGDCPVAEKAYEELISLPMFHGMHDEDVADVVAAVVKVVDHYSN